jgi:environmental stress-induced protein Ves
VIALGQQGASHRSYKSGFVLNLRNEHVKVPLRHGAASGTRYALILTGNPDYCELQLRVCAVSSSSTQPAAGLASALSVLRQSNYITMAWKSGTGRTAQLAIAPAGATLADFDYRLSCATMEQDNTFSTFPGYERALVLTRGCDISLRHERGRDSAGRTLAHERTLRVGELHFFDGAWNTTCVLRPSNASKQLRAEDFNVIFRANRYTCTVEVIDLQLLPRQTVTKRAVGRNETCFVYNLERSDQAARCSFIA